MTDHRLRHIPNAITMIRLILVLPIVISIIEGRYVTALILFGIAGASDGLDGYIARRFGWVSAFGRLIDPLADKLMMVATSVVLGWLGFFPMLLMLLIIVKDLAILGGVFLYTTLAGFPEIRPNRLGKVTTATQIILLLTVLLDLSFPGLVPGNFHLVWVWVVAVMTIIDGISYLWIWTVRLGEDPRWRETIR